VSPTRSAGAPEANGRYRKAVQFADAAILFGDDATTDVGEFGDACVTLAVHSGIASADVISISLLGEYSATGNHHESVAVLRRADPEAAKHLERLLAMKTKAGYAHRSASADDISKARRAHEALLARAAEVRGS
jgi:hypothetical protein